MMNENYRDDLPEWFEEQKEHDLVLSNDIDSLASCALLKKVKNWNIGYFYDFSNTYASKNVLMKAQRKDYDCQDRRVWVDVAALNGEKAFDNHLSMLSAFDDYNAQMINPNHMAGVTHSTYTLKYAGSTLLMLWSLYNLPLPKKEEGKMLLLAIDSMFKGHYSEAFEQPNTFYLVDIFGFEELYDCMERHTANDFYNLIKKYKLNEEISIKDGKLVTNLPLDKIGKLLELDIELPDSTYMKWKEYEVIETDVGEWEMYISDIDSYVFSLAFVFKNKVRYSRSKKEKKDEGSNYSRFKQISKGIAA